MNTHRQAGPAEFGHPARFITSPKGRRWLYRVALAVIALCVGYGLITDEAAALWGALAGAVVAIPVADANVNTDPA